MLAAALVAVGLATATRPVAVAATPPAAEASAVALGPELAATAAPPGASRLVPLPPTRLVDTRVGLGAPAARLRAGGTLTVPVAGTAGVPAGATAVVLNATVTETGGPGYLTLWPSGAARPTVSNVNAPGPDATVANLAVVALGEGGAVDLYAFAPMHVVLDVAGWFEAAPAGAAAGRFVPLTPARLLDTRTGTGAPARRPASGATTRLTVTGRGGVPAGAAAVALTLTATDATGPGFVTAWPGDRERPLASNLNLPAAGATVANAVVVPVGTDGTVGLYTQRAAELVVDVVGWFTGPDAPSSGDGLFVPVTPRRAVDTRLTADRLDGRYRRDLRLDLGAAAAGVVANLTVTETAAPLYLTAYPGRTVRPLASNVNADAPGATRANLAVVPLTAGNRASLYPSESTDLVVDVAGWFTGAPLPVDPGVADAAPTPKGAAQLPGFDAEIEAFLADKGATGASVAVSRGGRLVYARAYGLTDATATEATRVDSRFRLASLSKPLAAAATMRLVERGALRLDTPVWPLIDDVVPRPEGADARLAAVSVRDLLRHSAGFLGWMDPFFNDTREVVDGLGPAAATSCPQGAAWFLGWPLAYAPGEDQGYTNMDYCLLGAVLEAVTGKAWWQVVTDEVLTPAGLRSERVGRTRGDRQPYEAVHVTPGPDQLGGGWFMESLGAAGAWLGTAVDVVRFVDSLAAGGLVSPSGLGAMLASPGIVPGATAWWGLGLRNYGGGVWGHTGSLRQARAMFLHRPDGTSWAILVNGTFPDHGDELSALMARAIAAVPAWPTADLGPDLP